MAVNLSPIGGVAGQFFDNNGDPLSGGKIYTYAAGTTTPSPTYTTSTGTTPHANPIILDAAGRVPGGEIWLSDGIQYKFVIKTSVDVQIGSYDNIIGINSNFVNYTNSQEIQTATAGQTVFTLTTMQYQPSTNSLSVFVDGVNQYGPGASYAYQETSSTVVTFTSGLHVGASVKFVTSAINASSYGDASQIAFTGFNGSTGTVADLAGNNGANLVGFLQSGTGAIARSAQSKLRDIVSAVDFGADPTGTNDSSAAIILALAAHSTVVVPSGTYRCDTMIELVAGKTLQLSGGTTLRRFSAHSASTDPVVWVKGTGAALVGVAKIVSAISTENRCPKGVVRLGHKDMTESHENVTYCTVANLGIYGSIDYGQTTGSKDVCLYMPNPELGSPQKASYFHTVRSLRVSSANIGILLQGAANANTIDDITGQEIGNTTLGGAMLDVSGASDNRISNFFFHLSPATTFIRMVDDSGFVSAMNSMTNMVCEQGGAGYWLQANAGCTAANNYIQGQDNTTGGLDVSSAFVVSNSILPRSYISSAELRAPFTRVDYSLVKDGITEPNAVSGYAILFVDTADGDLKVKFSNAIVKTIATDT